MENQTNIASDRDALGSWIGPNVIEAQSPVMDGEAGGTTSRARRPTTTITTDPVQSVSHGFMPATTKAGLPRARMKWTEQVNIFIMRAYYTITHLETNTTAYRQSLYTAFITQYPEIQVTEQRVADQRRAIVAKNLLSPDILQQIREEVANTLHNQPQETNIQTSIQPIIDSNTDNNHFLEPEHVNITQININTNNTHSTMQSMTQTQNTTDVVTEQQDNITSNTNSIPNNTNATHNLDSTLTKIVKDEFNIAILQFYGTNPTHRHTIPKQNTSHRFASIISILNTEILPEYLKQHNSFIDVHTAIYCAAVAAARCNGSTTFSKTNTPNQAKHKNRKPAWETRLDKQIFVIRQELGRLTQYKQGSRTRRLRNHINQIFRKHRIHTTRESLNTTIIHYADTLTQKLAALSNRLRRYKESTLRKQQNHKFTHNEKQFYRSLNTKHQNISEPLRSPSVSDVESFWSSIWSERVEHNTKAHWIKEEEDRMQNIPVMTQPQLTLPTLKDIIKNTHSWKAPGTDNIHNYWYKKFTVTHEYLITHITHFINNPNTLPLFLTEGVTYMLPKDINDTINPSKYRPITCLQTIYKIITSCITHYIQEHIEIHNILAEQQKGCRQGSRGCKEQLLIDSVILRQSKVGRRNIYTTFVDYKKAFDSVPHAWLIQTLELYKIHPTLIEFMGHAMQHWNTKINLKTHDSEIITQPIQIRRGIFQGDSLSPLWFCLALNPLSHILDASGYGYNIRHNKSTIHKLTHLLYMDDIKLYASTEAHLSQLIRTVEIFSNDIKMEFGVDKCRTQSITQGRRELMEYDLQNGEVIDPMKEGEIYKYLGFQQSQHIEHKHIKASLQKSYTERLHTILKTNLNGRNIIKAINTYAVPILTYSFGVIQWTHTELEGLDRVTRTILTHYRSHHPKSNTDRITLPRKEGGRGLIDITSLHYKQIVSLRQYFYSKQSTSVLHNAIALADKNYTPLNLNDTTIDFTTNMTSHADKKLAWAQKSLHGRHYHDLEQTYVDKVASNAWLRYGDLFPETEGFMLAIQDQVINTRNYRKYILHDTTLNTDTCRFCYQQPETIQHIISSCKMLTQTDYLHRHNQVANIIHQQLAINCELVTTHTPYYKYIPETVLENDSYKLYYDRAIITDRTIPHNRPDIALIDKQNKITYIIDIAVPNIHNLQSTITGKLTKYNDLSHEVKQMWRMSKVVIVPIILSATGVIPYGLHTSLETLSLRKNIYITIQKSVILNTCRMVRKFLNVS